jgi:ectoine hydroxylase-related dioxygenase (phytanoyl-CoA dioxygenase family)
MEVIPGSHTKLFMNFNDSIKSLGNRKKIYIEQGDILLFYSNLLHRGIFTENLTHRRLIQVFEIFPSTKSFNKYKNQILHIKGNEQYSD